MADDTTVTRAVRIDLRPPDDAVYRAVLNSVRAYRAALRHGFALLAQAHLAGAEVVWTPDGECRVRAGTAAARVIGGLATGQATVLREPRAADHKRGDGGTYTVKLGNGAVYELRAELRRQLPAAMAFVLDSARRDIAAAWQAPDPEFPRWTRGGLVLQGSRGPALFRNRGVGMPAATARPRLGKRSLTLAWDHDIGPVEFGLGELDGGRLRVWQALRDGEWRLGTVYLSERDGKLFAVLSHDRPAAAAGTDPSRVARLVFPADDPDTLFRLAGPDGAATYDSVSAAGVAAFLRESAARRRELEARRGANGQPRRPWGFRKGWEDAQRTLDRHTLIRARVVADHNHAWSRRVADRAANWRCGVVTMGPTPAAGSPAVGAIGGLPWNWTEFRACLRYKLEERGIVLVESD